MIPFYYLFIFVLISLCSILEAISVQKDFRSGAFLLIAVLLCLTSALKYETGVDWYVYGEMFDSMAPINLVFSEEGRDILFNIDPGYNVLMATVKYFGGSLQTIYFILACVTSFFTYRSLKRYSQFPITGMLLYYSLIFFILDMSGVRQALSGSIFFYALRYVYERRLFAYCMTMLIAGLFHWSAFILLPLYPFLIGRFSNKTIIIVTIASLIVFVLRIKWLDAIIISLIPSISDKTALERISHYTTNKEYASGWFFSITLLINIFNTFLILGILLWKRKWLEARQPYFNIFLNIYLGQMVVYFAFSEFLEVSGRLRLYLLLSNLILIPLLIQLFSTRVSRLFPAFLIIGYSFLAVRIYIMESPATIAYSPYQNYIIYKVLDMKSTGMDRLVEQRKQFNSQ